MTNVRSSSHEERLGASYGGANRPALGRVNFGRSGFHLDDQTLRDLYGPFNELTYYTPVTTKLSQPIRSFSVARDNNVKLLVSDAEGQVLGEIATGHSKSIRRIAVWEDISGVNKSFIITASCDSTLRILDFDGNLISILEGVDGRVQCFAISPDQEFGNVIVVAAGQNRGIHVWSLATGQPLFICTGHSAEVVAISFCIGHVNIPAIVSGDRNGELRFWDRETGECLRSLLTKPP